MSRILRRNDVVCFFIGVTIQVNGTFSIKAEPEVSLSDTSTAAGSLMMSAVSVFLAATEAD
jgi:hypothetical protein